MATIDHTSTAHAQGAPARTSAPTPIKHQALSIALDAVQIRLDNAAPDGWKYRRLKAQKFALEFLAGAPGLCRDGRRA